MADIGELMIKVRYEMEEKFEDFVFKFIAEWGNREDITEYVLDKEKVKKIFHEHNVRERHNLNKNPNDLPIPQTEVLCFDAMGNYFVGWYYDGYWTDGEFVNLEVTEWEYVLPTTNEN